MAISTHPHSSIIASGALDGDKTVRLWRLHSELMEEKAEAEHNIGEQNMANTTRLKREEYREEESEEGGGEEEKPTLHPESEEAPIQQAEESEAESESEESSNSESDSDSSESEGE